MTYTQELTERLKKIVLTLLDMITSKKFLAATGSSFIIWYTGGDIQTASYPVIAYILMQGGIDIATRLKAND